MQTKISVRFCQSLPPDAAVQLKYINSLATLSLPPDVALDCHLPLTDRVSICKQLIYYGLSAVNPLC